MTGRSLVGTDGQAFFATAPEPKTQPREVEGRAELRVDNKLVEKAWEIQKEDRKREDNRCWLDPLREAEIWKISNKERWNNRHR